MLKRLGAVAALTMAFGLGSAAMASASSSVTSAFSDPYYVSGTNGKTAVIVETAGATSCSLTASPAAEVSQLPGTKDCSKGLYTGEVYFTDNSGTKSRVVKFEVKTNDGATGSFYAVQEPANVTVVTPASSSNGLSPWWLALLVVPTGMAGVALVKKPKVMPARTTTTDAGH